MAQAKETGGGALLRGGRRTVSRLAYQHLYEGPGGRLAPYKTLEVEGLSITPLPVLHGGEYVCLGFEFSPAHQRQEGEVPADRFVYLSDVSEIPPKIMSSITRGGAGSPPRVLVIDALKRTPHYSHFGLEEALEVCRQIRAERTLLVGMTCSMGDHDEVRNAAALAK